MIQLETVIINNGNLPNETFRLCNNLKNVTLGKGVKSIGNYAFSYLTPNSTIYCETQEVADLLTANINYTSSTTNVIVDASKF